MSSESGVPAIGRECTVHLEHPDLGQWLTKHGDYEAAYAGKRHVPGRDVGKSFKYIFGSGKGE